MIKMKPLVKKSDAPLNSLYRFMPDNYQEGFVNGCVPLGAIEKYKRMESVHGDASENTSFNKNEYGGVTLHSNDEHAYLLCCTGQDSVSNLNVLATKFTPDGKFFIEIYDPIIFLERVKAGIKNSRYKDWFGDVYWVKVQYDKGDFKDKEDSNFWNAQFFQKPKEQLATCVQSIENGIKMDAEPWLVASLPDVAVPVHKKEVLNNFEEEQEWRLVAELHSASILKTEWDDKLIIRTNWNCDAEVERTFEEVSLTGKDFLFIECGMLSDCVRIRNISDIEAASKNFDFHNKQATQIS